MNYYNVLGVRSNCSSEEIKQAYRNLAKQHHPDKNPQSSQFRLISEAHRILSNPELRQQYDQQQSRLKKQFQIYNLIKNFINGQPEKIENYNDSTTKETEKVQEEPSQKEIPKIYKRIIKKDHP